MRPRSSGIAGVFGWRTDDGRLLLYTHGLGPGDVSAKVLWWSRKEGGLLRLTGTRLDGDGVFRQQFQEAGVASSPAGSSGLRPDARRSSPSGVRTAAAQ